MTPGSRRCTNAPRERKSRLPFGEIFRPYFILAVQIQFHLFRAGIMGESAREAMRESPERQTASSKDALRARIRGRLAESSTAALIGEQEEDKHSAHSQSQATPKQLPAGGSSS